MPAAKLALAVNTHFYAESYTRGETALAVKGTGGERFRGERPPHPI